MTQKLLVIVIAAFFNATYLETIDFFSAEDKDIYIYGKVTTDDGEVYTGQIRWGKEEAFWFDFFNSSKPKNENLDYLSKSELKELRKRKYNTSWGKNLFDWGDNWNGNTHQFACQFGNIKSIEMGRGQKITVTFKDNSTIKLKGGSNDIDTYIQVTDKEVGHVKLEWDRIEQVDFMKATGGFESYYGLPLYGTVTSETGETFTGYVQWDHDERMAHDELNGKMKDGDVDLEFGNISKIKKQGRGSLVTLSSGRTLELRGTNDVNKENRGIIVNIPGQGRVDIPWNEFEEVSFTTPKGGVVDYDNFDGYKEISGTIRLENGQSHSGRLVFDLDEDRQLEILNGSYDDIEYFIPFSIIKSIKPSGRNRSNVSLVSGQTLELEDSVDVSDDNDGLLVFKDGSDDPEYILWEDIEEIVF